MGTQGRPRRIAKTFLIGIPFCHTIPVMRLGSDTARLKPMGAVLENTHRESFKLESLHKALHDNGKLGKGVPVGVAVYRCETKEGRSGATRCNRCASSGMRWLK